MTHLAPTHPIGYIHFVHLVTLCGCLLISSIFQSILVKLCGQRSVQKLLTWFVIPSAQLISVNPGRQLHLNSPIRLMQFPPLKHGRLKHSSMSEKLSVGYNNDCITSTMLSQLTMQCLLYDNFSFSISIKQLAIKYCLTQQKYIQYQ